MARIETDPNYSSPTFSRATAGTDIFKKEDVQSVAAALSTHDHSTGKGLAIGGASIPNGTITSAMIADGTIDTADLKDSSVTSAKIADGTIATADLANQAVTNQKLGTDTARLNLLTNGGFEIWQRGNGPFTTNGGFSADRWQIYIPQGTFSVSRDTANADSPSSFCAAITATGGTTPSAQQFYQYPFASADGGSGYQYAGRTLTVSARVKTTTANAVRLLLNPTGGTPAYSAYHSGGGTYQTLSATVTMPATVSAAILTIAINIEASCTAYLDNAMLVVGSVPADYAPLHPADDLARCLRYYQRFAASGSSQIFATGQCYLGNTAIFNVPYSAKAATASFTVSAASDFNILAANAGGLACTGLNAGPSSNYHFYLSGTVSSGLVAGNATSLQAVSSNAWYALESNP